MPLEFIKVGSKFLQDLAIPPPPTHPEIQLFPIEIVVLVVCLVDCKAVHSEANYVG